MNGWEKASFNGTLSPDDVLSFNFDKKLFSSSSEYRLDLEFRNVTLPTPGPPFTNYNDENSTHYEPAYLVVEVWE
jgi:hypothetical protein